MQMGNLDIEKLYRYLDNNGINRRELSKKMGASPNYISNIINGTTSMSRMGYVSMCNTFGVSESLFLKQPEKPEETHDNQLDRIEHKLDTILRRLWC